jgi:hypothetical protein
VGTHQRILIDALASRLASFTDDLERLESAVH